MRVITGTARGRKLKEPTGYDIRPTTDQVKEAMFNIAQFDIEGRRVLDLFGGTGQLGIEAASRGAGSVTIVDAARDSIKLIRENVASVGLPIRVVQADSIGFLRMGGQYDLIFIDPPYDSDLAEKALKTIKEIDILSEGGIIICETRRETALPELEKPYFLRKEYRYGKVKLTVYSKEC
ncbi:MAG: 16S rRNA (guanine(966)-N(2))-methyltransferase RsmD [Oscillospiraceae bacterium]